MIESCVNRVWGPMHYSRILICWLALMLPAGARHAAVAQANDPFAAAAPSSAARGDLIRSLRFVGVEVTNVFTAISDLTGWTVVMSPALSQKPPRINLWINNLSAEQALHEIAAVAGLIVQREGNVVRVMTFEEYGRLYGLEKVVIQLEHVSARDLVPALLPFVQGDEQSKVAADEAGNKLVLLVRAPLLASLKKLVAQLDTPRDRDTIRVVRVTNLEAAALRPSLERFLTESARQLAGRSAPGAATAGDGDTGNRLAGEGWLVQFMVEANLNVIVLRGQAADVDKTADLIAQLDADPGIRVVSYPLEFTNAGDVYETLRDIIESDARIGLAADAPGPRLHVAVSEQNNLLVVEGSSRDHARLAGVIAAVDKPLPPGSGGIRVYRLENASSAEVAAVLLDLVAERELGRGGALAIQQRDAAPGVFESAPPVPGAPEAARRRPQTGARAPAQMRPGDILPPQITEAPNINAVVIKASAVEQEEFRAVIEQLDRARDQVMLEVTLVALRSSDDFTLGVEVGAARIGSSGPTTIGFTKYGIGSTDSATGAVRIAPAAPFGLNYAIFNSDDFSLVLNALRTVGDTRVTSAPKILIEDNAVGEISQVSQEPYEVLSQGETTTTSTYGGTVDAGTTLTVTPHVAERDDWLRLEYAINLSRFGVRENPNLPPPVLQNDIRGTVRIPGGHTVVLGGLVATRREHVEDRVPLIGEVPLVGELFKNRSDTDLSETLFVFIRPMVLRKRGFEDLLFLSEQDIRDADVTRSQAPQNLLELMVPGPAVDGEPRP